MRANNVAIGSYILSYPAAILGIISINNIFNNIKYRFPILSLIGRNSMGIYLFHWIILTIVETLFTLFSIDSHQLYTAALIISNIILIPIIITLIRRSHYSDII
ncbi:MAG: acyltransferase family protein [Bacteroidaceae bacterium]|nr:acyltransferase family protein [Bacteroidaceae bacterium]